MYVVYVFQYFIFINFIICSELRKLLKNALNESKGTFKTEKNVKCNVENTSSRHSFCARIKTTFLNNFPDPILYKNDGQSYYEIIHTLFCIIHDLPSNIMNCTVCCLQKYKSNIHSRLPFTLSYITQRLKKACLVCSLTH